MGLLGDLVSEFIGCFSLKKKKKKFWEKNCEDKHYNNKHNF